jgi:hypothetical protein
MDIHFISSLNADDEDRLAPALLQALRPLLEMLPIAYTVRVQTASGQHFQLSRAETSVNGHDEAPLAYPAGLVRARSSLT